MGKNILIIISVIMVLTGTVGPAAAKETKFEVTLDRDRIAIGESTQLGLTFYGTQTMPAPDIGNIDGLELRYLGPSTMMTVINGKMSSSVTHMYTVIPLKTGKFQLGPFSFTYKNDTYTSGTVPMEVVEESPATRSAPAALPVSAEKLNLEDRIFMTLTLNKSRAYVNELVPVTIKLYVNRLNVRDIQLPTFAQEGFSKAEFKQPKQYTEQLGGLLYDVLEFKTNIFAARPGDYKLGPAKIKCNIIVAKRSRRSPASFDEFFGPNTEDQFFQGFFTRFEKYPMELKSEEVSLAISPLPTEGRPTNFSGAVGDFQFIFSVNPKKVRAGDPITVEMEINGTGNFNTVLQPVFENTSGFKVYDPEIKSDTNRKVFIQVLIPESDSAKEVPKAAFNYYDPEARVYKVISHGPVPIQVEAAKDEAPSQIVGPALQASVVPEPEMLTRDIIYIKDSLGRVQKQGYGGLYANKLFATAMGLPLISLIWFYFFTRRNERLSQDTAYAGRLRAPKLAKRHIKILIQKLKSGDAKVFYEALFAALQDYLGNRFNLPIRGVTYDAIEPILVSGKAGLDAASALKNLFDSCDQARFALLEFDELKVRDDLKRFEEIVLYFERSKI